MALLPQSKSEVNQRLSDQIILLYGRPKIGKSTLCSYFPDALFIATEPGLNHLSVFKVNVNNWNVFLEVCKEIAAEVASGKCRYKTLVIDTIDNLVQMCNEYICQQNDLDHISDMPMGKGWAKATAELTRVINKLSMLGIGLILVGHSKQEEIETKTKKYNRFTVALGGKIQDSVLALPDLILFMDSEVRGTEEIGVIRTKPSMYFEAGDKSKLLPEAIEFRLDNPKSAFDKIAEAFNKNNKQQ